ncbi:MAG: hypothetical protein M2R46_01991 [Verrucomicrobia subdivision 3 bacterium]|nr:hypothetical protein [Limisphaerales bacterium]
MTQKINILLPIRYICSIQYTVHSILQHPVSTKGWRTNPPDVRAAGMKTDARTATSNKPASLKSWG